MKKRITCFLFVIATILSNFCINVNANASLSEDSAKEFLRFLSGKAFYTPKKTSNFDENIIFTDVINGF